jgi:hypothetical protein
MPTNRKMSRRTWLRKVVLLTTAAWLPLMLGSASEAAQKVSKSVVHYRDYPKEMQMCGMCKFFEGGGMMGGGMMRGGMMSGGMMAGECDVVEGRISRMGWCDLYARRSG